MPLDIPPPASFTVNTDPTNLGPRWQKWKKGFPYYLDATAISNAKQRCALLLHVAGTEVQEILDTLPGPTGTLEDCLAALDNYFTPQVNVRYERFRFRQLE